MLAAPSRYRHGTPRFRRDSRLGFAFACSEIAMQIIGYDLGASAGGKVATHIGLALPKHNHAVRPFFALISFNSESIFCSRSSA